MWEKLWTSSRGRWLLFITRLVSIELLVPDGKLEEAFLKGRWREVQAFYLVVTDNPSVVRCDEWFVGSFSSTDVTAIGTFNHSASIISLVKKVTLFEFYISPATIYFPETLLCVSLSWLSSSPHHLPGGTSPDSMSVSPFFIQILSLSGLLSPLTAWLTWRLHICLVDGFPEALLHPTSCFFCPNFYLCLFWRSTTNELVAEASRLNTQS